MPEQAAVGRVAVVAEPRGAAGGFCRGIGAFPRRGGRQASGEVMPRQNDAVRPVADILHDTARQYFETVEALAKGQSG